MTALREAFLERDARAKAQAALTLTEGGMEPGWPDRPARPERCA